jgi:hypothetical protein
MLHHNESAVADDDLKDKISESDKNAILGQCNDFFHCLNANQLA